MEPSILQSKSCKVNKEKTYDNINLKSKDQLFHNVEFVIAKVTNRCNTACEYCHEDINGYSGDMPISVYKNLINKTLQNTTQEVIHLIFHGGEPTLLSDKWYLEAVNYTEMQAIKYNKKVYFGIQSNLISISDSTIELFKLLKIKVSVSTDGPSTIISPMRFKTETSYNNIKRLQDGGLQPGILMTINKSNYRNFPEIMKWLHQDLKVTWFKANPVTIFEKYPSSKNMQPSDIFIAYRDILEYMMACKNDIILEANLILKIQKMFLPNNKLAKNNNSICSEKSCGAGRTVLAITTEGMVIPCGRYLWNDKNYYIDNIKNLKKDNVDYHLNWTNFINQEVKNLTNDCTSCKAKEICTYGCRAFINRSPNKFNVDCLPTKMLYNYFNENQERLKKLIQILAERERLSKNLIVNYDAYGGDYSDYSDYSDYNDY